MLMQLSEKALRELREILRRDLGEEGLRRFTDEGINDLGVRLLYLTAICLKARAEERTQRIEKASSEPS